MLSWTCSSYRYQLALNTFFIHFSIHEELYGKCTKAVMFSVWNLRNSNNWLGSERGNQSETDCLLLDMIKVADWSQPVIWWNGKTALPYIHWNKWKWWWLGGYKKPAAWDNIFWLQLFLFCNLDNEAFRMQGRTQKIWIHWNIYISLSIGTLL